MLEAVAGSAGKQLLPSTWVPNGVLDGQDPGIADRRLKTFLGAARRTAVSLRSLPPGWGAARSTCSQCHAAPDR